VYNGDGMGFFCVLVSDLGRIWRLREGQDGSETSSDAFRTEESEDWKSREAV
jgi:hypothetical protein